MENCPTSWVNEQEMLLKDWAEKARYYSWMHSKAGNLYVSRNNKITIPLIIISTLSGSANFSMVGVQTPHNWVYTVGFPLVMGILSIISAILSAMTKYLRTAELSENHHEFHKKYNSLFRNISLELSLPANQRKSPTEICNLHRYEFDRLVSESPNIPEVIINEFNTKFPFVSNKPEITHSFDKIVIHGRNQALQNNLDKLLKIRNFYKLAYSTKLSKNIEHYSNKTSSIDDVESQQRDSQHLRSQTSFEISTPTEPCNTILSSKLYKQYSFENNTKTITKSISNCIIV